MIWLTRTVYAAADTTPSDLIALTGADGKAAIENHLMSKLIPALYDQAGGYQSRTSANWKPEMAER